MIQKAIEKINEEIKSGGIMERNLGEYVKSELLKSDNNALKVLAPNTDLETFMERIWKIANSMRNFKSDKDITAAGRDTIAVIKGIKLEDVAENSNEVAVIGNLYSAAAKGKKDNGVCLTSEIVIPLLHIYYGIPLEAAHEKNPAPKRRRFNTVSLD